MYLCREEVVKILEIMDKFPAAGAFELLQDTGSGIGSVTTLTVSTEINKQHGEFKIVISDQENW